MIPTSATAPWPDPSPPPQVQQEIKQLSQIEHVLHRPSMYVGSITKETQEEFILQDDIFIPGTREYIPALIKTFNEWIDNSIDEFVRTQGKFANKISVKMTDKTFECQDNGRGIPNIKMTTLSGKEKYQAEVAFTEMLSGANYDDNNDEATIGTNGLGAKAGSIFAKKTTIINDDGKSRIQIITKDNLSDISVIKSESRTPGIHTKVYPDLKYFNIEEIDEVHQNVIKERLLHLSIAYPGITFKFNAKSLKINPKNYFSMFGCTEFINLNDNVQIAVGPSENDQFEHFSLVNGLITKSGGSHMDYVSKVTVQPIRDKLAKKFKTIMPADVKSKLRMVIIFREFKNARYTSQTKEQITNSRAEITSYLGNTQDIEKLVKKIQKNDDIMLPITELFLLREQAKANAAVKKAGKNKKVKSEKYLPANNYRRILFLCEGDSAVGGLMPALGRAEFGFYALKGVPLNAYDSPTAKFAANKELSEVFSIIQTEGYDYIVTATDADADGSHIKGLLIGFFDKYLPEYLQNGRFGELATPVQAVIKNKKLQRWVYTLGDPLNLKAGETGKYYKGLGSFKSADLAHIVKTDGIENMIQLFNLDDKQILNDWLAGNKADKRKEYLSNNYFDIATV